MKEPNSPCTSITLQGETLSESCNISHGGARHLSRCLAPGRAAKIHIELTSERFSKKLVHQQNLDSKVSHANNLFQATPHIPTDASRSEIIYFSHGVKILCVDREKSLKNLLESDIHLHVICLLYTSPSPRDKRQSRMPSSA